MCLCIVCAYVCGCILCCVEVMNNIAHTLIRCAHMVNNPSQPSDWRWRWDKGGGGGGDEVEVEMRWR